MSKVTKKEVISAVASTKSAKQTLVENVKSKVEEVIFPMMNAFDEANPFEIKSLHVHCEPIIELEGVKGEQTEVKKLNTNVHLDLKIDV